MKHDTPRTYNLQVMSSQFRLLADPFIQHHTHSNSHSPPPTPQIHAKPKLQLIILIQIHRLQQTPHLPSPLSLRLLCIQLLLLALLGEEIRVVARELLELDQEIAQVDFELDQVLAVAEETLDEVLDLDPVYLV